MGVRKHTDAGGELHKFGAPQTELMAIITDGILARKLPWTLVVLGALIAVVLELSRVSSLPFAVGVYLPFSISTPVFVGGLVRWLVDRWGPRPDPSVDAEAASETSQGSLLSTGYIAGGAIGGVLIPFCNFSEPLLDALKRFGGRLLGWLGVSPAAAEGNRLPLAAFAVLVAMMVLVGMGWIMKNKNTPSDRPRHPEPSRRLGHRRLIGRAPSADVP